MHDRIRTYVLSAIAAPMIFLAAQPVAFAQSAPATQSAAQAHRQAQQQSQTAPAPVSDEEFKATQEQLLQLLRTSPTLTTVVAHDPSLLSDQEYVNRNNPQLAQFLVQHPDVARNPEYYLFTHLEQHGRGPFRRDQALERAVWPDMAPPDHPSAGSLEAAHALIPIIIVPSFFFAVVWIVKLIIESLRWNRAFRQQGEIHSRLIDKLGTSQDLAAYMETEAGKRFLTGAPLALGPDLGQRMPNAVARILTPLQVGVVMVLLGIGFLLLRNASPDTSTPMLILGTLILMPGIGFILSAGITWVLAARLGLMPPGPDEIEVRTQGRQ